MRNGGGREGFVFIGKLFKIALLNGLSERRHV